MDVKKLDKWADLLLDTGKRNNLINFKDAKASTAEILFPSSEELFDKIEKNSSFEVYDPKIVEEDDIEVPSSLEQQENEESKPKTRRSAYLSRYSGKITRANQILLYNSSEKPISAVKNIDKKTREIIEETGVNVAYMAFGFIHWSESEHSKYVFRAPVLLVPVLLEQASAVEPYIIKPTEDDIITNPTFAYKIEAEYGVKLPDYDDEGLTEYLEKVEKITEKLGRKVTSECKIGIFSFLKINMYRDLKDNAEAILANGNIRQLLGEPVETKDNTGSSGNGILIENPLIELHNVVDADSSQIEAIEMAKSGESFVLQGPPGTGKSQTITNIIAECLSDGKKVLFVSEKLAALNVVYDKLKQAGLSEFCLELHSHKANKKAVIDDLCHTLRSNKSVVSAKAETEIAIKEKAQQQLDNYAEELHKQRPVIEKSLYQLYENYAEFRTVPDIDWAVPGLNSKGEAYLTETASLLEQYTDYIPSIGYDYRKNIWYGYINQDTSYQSRANVKNKLTDTVGFLNSLIPVMREISEKYGISCENTEQARIWRSFFRFASSSQIITPSLLNKERFDQVYTELKQLKSESEDILAFRAEIDTNYKEGIYEINGGEYYGKLTEKFYGFFSRLFNSEYKSLVKDLRLCKKDEKKPSYSQALAITELLSKVQKKTAEYFESEKSVKACLGSAYNGIETNWVYVTEQMETLQSIFTMKISFGKLADYSDYSVEKDNFAAFAEKLDSVFSLCGEKPYLKPHSFLINRFLILIYQMPLYFSRSTAAV